MAENSETSSGVKKRRLRDRWWKFYHTRCLVGFPWFWPARPPGSPVMVAARRIVRQRIGSDHPPFHRALARLLMALAWPLAVLIHLQQIRRYGEATVVPIARMPGAFWAALRHNVLPSEYFVYGLWRPERKANIDDYLYGREGPRLFKLLNRPSEPNPIDDKLAFHELCKAHALPTPEILAVFTPTGKLMTFESDLPPIRDLFVKPRLGMGGNGCERLRWRGGVFESSRGFRLVPEELRGYLETRAQTEKRTLLVQPNLSNHPRLHLRANSNLAAARLITGLSDEGKVSAIIGFIYFPEDDQVPARNLRAELIDVASGRLMRATQEFSVRQRPNHRLDNRSDDACMLPDWNFVLRHTEGAHQACCNFVFLGWDVAFTEQGPMLLEGNANWCADEYQRLRGEPLGHTKFAHILEGKLKLAARDHPS